MNLLMMFAIVIVVAWAYILLRHPLLDRFPRLQAWHQIEDRLWANSRTLLIARLYTLGGIIIAIHDGLAQSGVNVTPILEQITSFLPEKYRPLGLALWVVLTGVVFEWLRHATSKPLSEKS